MKKVSSILLFLLAINETIFASTGERSDDYLVLLVPMIFIFATWVAFEIKTRLKARKERLEQMHQQMAEHGLTQE